MANLHLHDHGWLALPAELRQRLGLHTGDRLSLEMIEGGVRLRLAGKETKAEGEQPAPAPALLDQPPAKQGRGRPRKQVQADPVVVEPQAELPLQPMKVQEEKAASKTASTGKHAMRGLFPRPKIGGRRKSEPVGTT